MSRFDILLGVVSVGIAALHPALAFISGTMQWFAAAAGSLLAGLIIGLLLGRRAKAKREPHKNHQETRLSDGGIIDFSPKLLDATINEMREGLLVIDGEMRVVASNRAARGLFSNIEDSIGARRLTELTRNPAIYAVSSRSSTRAEFGIKLASRILVKGFQGTNWIVCLKDSTAWTGRARASLAGPAWDWP